MDNGPHLANIAIPDDAPLSVAFDETLLGGVATIQSDAYRTTVAGWQGTLYAPSERETYEKFTFQAIPYCLWANRTAGEMRVWLRRTIQAPLG